MSVSERWRSQLDAARVARWAKSPRIDKPCEVCGAIFRATPKELANGRDRFCSLKCKGIASRLDVKSRFLSRISKTDDECWVWIAHRGADGYGILSADGRRNARAHRVSWELFRGPIPHGLWVLHKCDNRPCVNPDHLFLGNRSDNMRDAAEKGRLRSFWAFRNRPKP
jgi:hypothetical protein